MLLKLIWLALPAYAADAAMSLAARLPFLKKLNFPIDFGIKLGKQRLFGPTKTWRGLAVAAATGIAVSAAQAALHPLTGQLNLYNYQHWAGWGACLGLGDCLGDLLKSFFKRRLGFAPGKPWIPFDQLNLLVGLGLGSIYFWPGLQAFLALAVATIPLHLAINYIAFKIGISKKI